MRIEPSTNCRKNFRMAPCRRIGLNHSRLRRAVALMDENLAGEISTDAIADELDASVQQLER
jgi:transcriptional regulator GlxA family with amidase domain